MDKVEISYADAYRELMQIVGEVENQEVSIDELSSKVKRATFLLKLCENKLNKTEEEINEIVGGIKE